MIDEALKASLETLSEQPSRKVRALSWYYFKKLDAQTKKQ